MSRSLIYNSVDCLIPEYVDTYTLRSMCYYIECVAKLKQISFNKAEEKWKIWAGVEHLSSITPNQAQQIIYRCKQILGFVPSDYI